MVDVGKGHDKRKHASWKRGKLFHGTNGGIGNEFAAQNANISRPSLILFRDLHRDKSKLSV